MEFTISDPIIKFPEMRAEMLNYLDLVGKIRRDQEALNATENLEYIVHYFFDDTEVAQKPDEYIGITLISKEEVSVIGIFGKLLNEYLEKFSPGTSPLRFEDGEEW
jgi:hypothetical protein